MKKLLIALLLLAIIGGVAFFFGWVSFRLDGEEYGVAFTKSDGWIEEPVNPGEFRWMWQALLPTNLTLHTFPLTPLELSVSESGSLPSAELYSRYVEGEPSFSYTLDFTVTYRIDPEATAAALAAEETTPESFDTYQRSRESSVQNASRRAIVRAIEAVGREPMVALVGQVAEAALDELRGSVEGVEILTLTISEAEVPDPFVYRSARENYLALQEGRREGLTETARDAAAARVLDEERRRALEEYGRILMDYPVLLDYFRLTAETGADPLDLEPLQNALQQAQ